MPTGPDRRHVEAYPCTALEASQLLHQESAGAPIPPGPIVEVAGQQHEIDLLLPGEVDHVDQCVARRAPNPLGRRVRVEPP